ncbi:MAG: hypothetical protein KDB22_23930 [Planctomycetales bacterium]|nr:hypothetical protein [Planctomycetales bacterium]
MRKILTLTRYGTIATAAVVRRTAITALGYCLAVTLIAASNAVAQSTAYTLAPTATSGVRDAGMVSWASGNAGLAVPNDIPTVDASYSLLNDTTQVQQAQFGNRTSTGPTSFNPGCDVSWYGSYDALWLNREDDKRFSLSRNSFMPDFDFEFGGRYTVGRLLNCVNGWEGVYVGPFDWTRSSSVTGPGNLSSNFRPFAGFDGGTVTAFNDADLHTQTFHAELNSFELNRRWWSWDVISTMIGVRYVEYKEDYVFSSVRNSVGPGQYIDRIDNQMAGAHVGADLLYPVSLRTNMGFRLKGGVFANFAERTTFMTNNGTLVINTGDTKTDVAGVIEGGVYANYSIVPSIRLTGGYDFWYLPGSATIPGQNVTRLNPDTGTSIFNETDLFFHGGSVGVQVLF